MVALDASGSVGKTNFEGMIRFVQNIVEELPIDGEMRIGLETFADNEKVVLTLSNLSLY